MAENTTTYSELFVNWDEQHFTEDQITDHLQKEGYVGEQIAEIVRLYKKKKMDERTRKGFILMAIGSTLGFISCVFTVYEIIPALRDVILYGLTSVGITLALWGGYYVFE